MRTLKFLSLVFCFCGLFASCGNEPKETENGTTSDTTTDVATPAPETVKPNSTVAPILADTTIVKTEKAIEEKTKEEMEQIALAAKKAQQREKDAEAEAKEKLAKEKRREKRRAKRRAKREKEAAEKALREKEAKEKKEPNIASSSSPENQQAATNGHPMISFKKTLHNYGRISQGEKVTHNFVFTNTGTSELVISNVEVSCGCTHPSFPFIPIAPGAQDYIGVVFDSKGRLGRQKPIITVTTNAEPAVYKLYLEGTVDSDKIEEDGENDTTPKEGN